MIEYDFLHFHIEISQINKLSITVTNTKTQEVKEYQTFIKPDIYDSSWVIEQNECVLILGIDSTDSEITYKPFFIYTENYLKDYYDHSDGLKVGMTKFNGHLGDNESINLSCVSNLKNI